MRLPTKPSKVDSGLKLLRGGKIVLAGAGVAVCALVLIGALSGCNSKESGKGCRESEEYHADNDIAMTVKSVSDAFTVGEPLTETDYRFEGVLTDGAGRPLYTDIMGTPGVWEVTVVSPRELKLRNVYLGDLLAADLRQYLEESLELGEPLREGVVEDADGHETQIVEYSIPGGKLRVATTEATAANGVTGPMVSITLTKA